MHKKQFGITSSAVVAGLLLVAGLGGGGYYVYHAQQRHTAKTTTASTVKQSAATTNTPQTAPTAQNTAIQSDQYLTIDKLRVRVKLTEQTKDLETTGMTSDGKGAYFNLASYRKASASYLSCSGMVTLYLLPATERKQMEQDSIYPVKFDAAGKPLAGQYVIQLQDGRYASILSNNGDCFKGKATDAQQKTYTATAKLINDSLHQNLESY